MKFERHPEGANKNANLYARMRTEAQAAIIIETCPPGVDEQEHMMNWISGPKPLSPLFNEAFNECMAEDPLMPEAWVEEDISKQQAILGKIKDKMLEIKERKEAA